jgi:hypothetical protein
MHRVSVWVGRALTILIALFCLFDAGGKLDLPAPVTDLFTRLALSLHTAPLIAVALLISTLFYVIPRTALFGAILLTGYLGGVVSLQLRAGGSRFEIIFPIIFGFLAWMALFLRHPYLAYVLIHGAETPDGREGRLVSGPTVNERP